MQEEFIMDKLDFLMEIEGINHNSKRGLVASGKVNNGVVCLGDCLEIVGENNILKTYVAAIEKLSKNNEETIFSTSATSGDNIQLLLTNSRNDNINIGHVLSTPKTVRPHLNFEAQFSLLNPKRDVDLLHSSCLECSVHFRKNSKSNAKLYLLGGKSSTYLYNHFYILLEMEHTIIFDTGCKFDVFCGLYKIGTGIVNKVIQ